MNWVEIGEKLERGFLKSYNNNELRVFFYVIAIKIVNRYLQYRVDKMEEKVKYHN